IKLSTIGQIIKNQWNNIPIQYDNIELDHYVIMPNHIHGIIIINKRAWASSAPTVSQIFCKIFPPIYPKYSIPA
ncbi:MAG: hypothetical protein KKF54_02740, partial [Candidatus Omnitrophica bacterium]|nr:hypothetical protein [Candidatus Omnitrophota bacterium]